MSARSPRGDVAVVIAARNEADRIAATVAAATGLAGLVVVVDDGSRDATAALAERAGAVVMRHPRNQGKGAAMETGAEAIRLVDQTEHRDHPRHLLFLDADLGDTATHAGPLMDPVLAGTGYRHPRWAADGSGAGRHRGHDDRGLRRHRQAWRARPGGRPLRSRYPPGHRLAAAAAAERTAVPDPRGVRGRPPAGARLGGGDRAHHRPAAPGTADHRG